jgi:hypothetical protein
MQQNKQILIDAVVHAVNEDYAEMANDFTRLGFLASGTDVSPIIPALEAIWQNSAGKGLADFNFRSVTGNVDSLNVLLYLFFCECVLHLHVTWVVCNGDAKGWNILFPLCTKNLTC